MKAKKGNRIEAGRVDCKIKLDSVPTLSRELGDV
jgi:hypothetical protein